MKKGDKADPGDYGGITPISTVGKKFCKILHGTMGTMLKKDGNISEGQAGFLKTIQGRKDAGLTTYCFFLHVQKAWRSAATTAHTCYRVARNLSRHSPV